MALNVGERVTLWDRAGSRCSICKRVLSRDSQPGVPAARELPIRTEITGFVLPPRYFDTHENYMLLCAEDGQTVTGRRDAFTTEVLLRIKLDHEDLVARTSATTPTTHVSLLVHSAFFGPGTPAHYFLKITNEGTTSVQLESVWFATTPAVAVDNHQRPLPTLLVPGELFETWLPVVDVPATPRVEYLACARLADGTVVESLPNTAVPPAGAPGGGGAPLTAFIDSVAAINHDGEQLLEKEWDVFISHATEDKDDVVRPLAHALRYRGVRVWYDEFELRIGDSLRRRIDEGISRSRFGVVVLSPSFFAKGWTTYELDGIIMRAVGMGSLRSGQVVLPILHKISVADLMARSPSLVDRLARDTATTTVTTIADEIAEVVSRTVAA